MSYPKITVTFQVGNLLKSLGNVDGFAGMVLTGSILASTPKEIYSLTDAEDLGITEGDEPYAHRQIKEFYKELGGKQKLHIMLVPDTMTMADMLDTTETDGAIKLCTQTNREIALLGIGRDPASGYDGGSDFIDSDVSAALTASNAFGANRVADLHFPTILIESRVENPSAANTLTPTSLETNFGTSLLGGTKSDGSASIGMALGRAVKYGVGVKLGKVANGPVQASKIYIGDKLIEERNDVATLHGEGFISFMQHPSKGGYYFGIDRMANTGDYSILARRRVANKAAVIATATMVDDLEGEADITPDGKIDPLELGAIKERVEAQIKTLMGDQISAVKLIIEADQDIINTSTLEFEVSVQPKGYKSFINIPIGLTTSLS